MTETMKKRLEQLENGVIDLCETFSQLKESLCGKENVTLAEFLTAVNQLKSRLAQVEKERDAAVSDLKVADKLDCQFCVHNRPNPGCEYDCEKCENKCTCNLCRNNDKYEWRGP